MFRFIELIGEDRGVSYGYVAYRGSHHLATLNFVPNVESREGGVVATALHSGMAQVIADHLGFPNPIPWNEGYMVVT